MKKYTYVMMMIVMGLGSSIVNAAPGIGCAPNQLTVATMGDCNESWGATIYARGTGGTNHVTNPAPGFGNVPVSGTLQAVSIVFGTKSIQCTNNLSVMNGANYCSGGGYPAGGLAFFCSQGNQNLIISCQYSWTTQ